MKNIGELLVMVEYCRYGSLKSYIMVHRNRFVNQVDVSGILKAIHGAAATENGSSSVNHESE